MNPIRNRIRHPLQRITPALAGLFIAGLSSVQAAEPQLVDVVSPSRGTVYRWIRLPGVIRADKEATLFAKVSGYLQRIDVDKGDAVKAGQTLAVLETPELSADQSRYKAEVAAARSEYDRLSKAQAQAPDLVTPLELDRAKGRLDVAVASLERAQTLLGFNRIVAPFAGTVTRRFVDPGAFIPAATAGSAAQSAAVVTVMDFSKVRVQVAVPETEARLVKKGWPVKVSLTGVPDAVFDGVVTRFSYALEDGSKTMLAEMDLPNPKSELRPNMYAVAQVALERHDNVLRIPVSALITEKTRTSVFVLNGQAARKVAVKAGFNDGSYVEVQEGISETDRIIQVGKLALSDGAPVRASGAKP